PVPRTRGRAPEAHRSGPSARCARRCQPCRHQLRPSPPLPDSGPSDYEQPRHEATPVVRRTPLAACPPTSRRADGWFRRRHPGRTQTTLRASACVVPDVPEGTKRQLGAVGGTEVIVLPGAVTAAVPRLTSRRAKGSRPDGDKPRATQLIANGYPVRQPPLRL